MTACCIWNSSSKEALIYSKIHSVQSYKALLSDFPEQLFEVKFQVKLMTDY